MLTQMSSESDLPLPVHPRLRVNVLISQRNLIFNSQQISVEGLLQAIAELDVCPDLLPLGLTVGALMPTVPLREPLFSNGGDPGATAVFLKLAHYLGSLLNIRFLGLGSSAPAPPQEWSGNLSLETVSQ